MRTSRSVASAFCAGVALSLLSGCASGFDPDLTGGFPTSSGSISGTASGGRQPISGAHIYVMQAGTTAYAGPGIAASGSNKATSLLSSGDGSDSIGTYVLTNASGAFSVSTKYSCTTGNQVYLLSIGGDTGSSVANSAAGLMAVLGTCGTDFSSSTKVNMNEVSTVAAAYAMAGFATDATHVGIASSSLASTGIKNAFKNASQLYDISSNYALVPNTPARTTTPGGNGAVPQSQIDTIANILAACVNTTGPSSTQCSTLFSNVGNNGAAPTETATAAIDIAQHPGKNVTTIYGITGGSANPFTPWWTTSAPTDFAVAITYSGGGMSFPWAIATDASGYVWVGNSSGSGGLTQLTPQGVSVNGTLPYIGSTFAIAFVNGITVDTAGNVWVANNTGNGGTTAYGAAKVIVSNEAIQSSTNYMHGGVESPGAVAVDGSNDAWLVNSDNFYESSLTGLDTNGNALSGSPYSKNPTNNETTNGLNGLNNTFSLCVDSSNNIWTGNFGGNGDPGSVTKFSNAGAVLAHYTTGVSTVYGVAVDSGNNIWAMNYNPNNITKLTNSGGVSATTTNGGVNGPYGIAVDGDSRPWVVNNSGNSLSNFDTSGTALSPSTGYIGPSSSKSAGPLNSPYAIQLDTAGNVWIANYTNSNVVEFVGIATPVYAPLASAVANNKLGQRP